MDEVKLLDDLEALFTVDDYEETMYPVIKQYLLYRRGRFIPVEKYDLDILNRAFMLLGTDEWLKSE